MASSTGPPPGSPRARASSRPPRAGRRRPPRAPPAGRSGPRVGCPCGIGAADHEAAVDRGGDVVGMALERARPGEHLLLREAQLEEVVGGEEAGDDRRGARAEAAGQRDLAAHAEGDRVGGAQALEGADDQVVAVGAHVGATRVEGELARPPAPRARARARPPRPSRRSPAPGWPRRRGRGPAAGGGSFLEHRPLDRAQVVLAVDHRRRFRERRVGVLEAVAGEHADDRLGRLRRPRRRAGRGRAGRPPRRPTPARRRPLRWPPASGRRRGSARR